jgi:3-ketosteroid 9alpha-monooxygenase subunit A
MHQRQRSAVDPVPGVFDATYSTHAGYVGPGLAFGRFIELQAIQLICVTPIEDGQCRLWQVGMIKSRSGAVDADARAMREGISAMFGNGLMTDAEVWRAKRPAIQIMQLPGDGPFRQSRVWYSQFYNPRAMADAIVARVAGVHTAKGWPPYTAEAAE